MKKSPLSLDKANVKEYKIDSVVELHPRQKLAFLEAQLNELKAMHFRARIDMLHAARLQEEKNPTLREKGLSNMSAHRNEVEQTIGAIKMLSTLIEEIREETGTGEVLSEDHPDGY